MRITQIEAIPFKIPLAKNLGKISSSIWSMEAANHVLIKIASDEGLEGFGEAVERPTIYGETQASIVTIVKEWLSPQLVGLDPYDLEKIWDRLDKITANNTAKAAIDVAIYDLIGKKLGFPIHKLLGSWDGQKIRVASLLPLGSPEKTVATALERKQRQGIQAFKIKVGQDLDRDVKTLMAMREALGDEAILYVDANQAWSPFQAIKAIKAMEPYGLAWVEEPIKKGDFAGKLRVANQISVPILLDESATSPEEVWQQIRMDMNCIINIKPARTGFTISRKIIHLAQAANIPCLIGTARETGLGMAASIQFGTSFKNILLAEVADSDIYEHNLLEDSFQIKSGYAYVPSGPGLGVQISTQGLQKYMINQK